jgi:hypothetical protein
MREAVLTAQGVTLNAIFANLAYQAKATNSADTSDRCLRLAFKAQSQCRTTFETLALLKNPPVFTRQANITSQQIVNNKTMVATSRAEIPETVQNKLLKTHGERLDGRRGGRGKQSRYGAGDRGNTRRDRERRRASYGSRETPTAAGTGRTCGRRLGYWRNCRFG